MAVLSPRKVRPALRWLRAGRGPLFVSWMITEACNYVCDHCGCWRDPPDELSAEQAAAYAREMVQAGVVAVSLCGGEVTLRRDLGAILRILGDAGISTRITSNGMLVPARIDDLRPLSRLKISLDGPPDLQDDIRGAKAFERVVAALEAARGAGIPVTLNTVLHARLLPRLDELLELVGELGVSVTFNPLETRHASAADGVQAAAPSPEDHRAAVQHLVALKKQGDPRLSNSLGTLELMLGWPELPPVDCNAGRWFCRVLADGRVAACDRDYAPQRPPPEGSPLGFAIGLAKLERAGHCGPGCWRNNTIEINRSFNGAMDAMAVIAGWA